MTNTKTFGRLTGVLFGLLLLTSCGDSADPLSLEPAEPSFASSGPVLVECPTDTFESVTGEIGPLGGSLSLRQHQLSLPLNAVTLPTDFSLSTPVSNYMELSVEAVGHDDFQFGETSTITIDYSRCTRSNIDKDDLSVWEIDPETKELLEFMGGVDDKDARTVTFQTDHLSTYSIAH